MNKERVIKNQHIKPIVQNKLIKNVDLFDQSFIWNPTYLGKVKKMKAICTIDAFSYFGHPSLFKPSIAEVIDSIPEDLIKEVNYFQIVSEAIVHDHEKHVFKEELY